MTFCGENNERKSTQIKNKNPMNVDGIFRELLKLFVIFLYRKTMSQNFNLPQKPLELLGLMMKSSKKIYEFIYDA